MPPQRPATPVGMAAAVPANSLKGLLSEHLLERLRRGDSFDGGDAAAVIAALDTRTTARRELHWLDGFKLPGKVVSITPGQATANVTVDVAGMTVVAAITVDACGAQAGGGY